MSEAAASVADLAPAASTRPAAWMEALRGYGWVALQVALCLVVIHAYQVESHTFRAVAGCAALGFLVNAALPARLRLPFFLALSIGMMAWIFGRSGAWMLGIGLGLIGLCHLPIRFGWRLALIASAGAGLALMRGGVVASPVPVAIWPILGSMFMFRLIVYLYDLSHEKTSGTIWEKLSYFFLLPNLCFALFPVIDYKTWRRSHAHEDGARVAQVGVEWIARGVIHLLLYRAISHYGAIPVTEIATPLDLLRYLVCNFGVYLNVSGIFHIAIGMLRLFGFNLPETHYFYFASSSINDFWRRINIYWKDFMMKVFYYPAFFRLRRGGTERALILATLFVVVITWAFHSWQWFWIRGNAPFMWQDAAFWGVLGLLMIANSLYETRHSKARGRRARSWTVRSTLTHSLQIGVTFPLILVLWSLWTAGSWAEWLGMWKVLWRSPQVAALAPGFAGGGWLGALLFVGLALPAGGKSGKGSGNEAPSRIRRAVSEMRSGGASVAALAVLALLAVPDVRASLDDPAAERIASFQTAKLSRYEAAQLQRGYYEDLIQVDRFNANLSLIYQGKPRDWKSIESTDAMIRTGDPLRFELKPNYSLEVKGAPLNTNAWGIRDRDYTLEKPPGTTRFVLVGSSYALGAGVGDEATFENVLEDRLNAAPGQRYEVLNFAVGGYDPMQRMLMLEKRALRFAPDAVLYIAHEAELGRLAAQLRELEDAERAAADPELAALLDGDRQALLAGIYRRTAAAARAADATPIWVMVPTLAMAAQPPDTSPLAALAEQAGFVTLDLAGAYGDRNVVDLAIAPWDYHPNEEGHQLIAQALHRELLVRPELLEPQPATQRAGATPESLDPEQR